MSKSRHAERVVWTLTVCTALSLVGDATLYAVLPSQYLVIGVTALQVGVLLSINRLVRLPLNLISGWLSNRMGAKLPYVAGLLVGVISTVGYGLAKGFWPLLLLRALWGVSWALIAVSAYGLVLDVSTETTRGRLMGIYASGSYFGGALGALLGGFLVDALGFSKAMLILGALTTLGCLGALTLPHRRHKRSASDQKDFVSISLARRLHAIRESLSHLNPRLWLIMALNFTHRLVFAGVFYATFGYYLNHALGDQVHVGGIILGIASLTATLLFVRNVLTVLAGPALGYLSARLGDRTRVLLLGELLGVSGLVCFAVGSSPWLLGIGVFGAAIAYGIVPPMLLSWLGDITPNGRRGAIVGSYQTMGDLGSGLGPLIAYPLLALMDIRLIYALCATLLALTIPAIIKVRRWSDLRHAIPDVAVAERASQP